jgi:hypothetical protein
MPTTAETTGIYDIIRPEGWIPATPETTAIYDLKQGYQQQQKKPGIYDLMQGGIPATAETKGIYDLKHGYQQQQKQRGYTTHRRDTRNSRNNRVSEMASNMVETFADGLQRPNS